MSGSDNRKKDDIQEMKTVIDLRIKVVLDNDDPCNIAPESQEFYTGGSSTCSRDYKVSITVN